jgi:hypothetical protein
MEGRFHCTVKMIYLIPDVFRHTDDFRQQRAGTSRRWQSPILRRRATPNTQGEGGMTEPKTRLRCMPSLHVAQYKQPEHGISTVSPDDLRIRLLLDRLEWPVNADSFPIEPPGNAGRWPVVTPAGDAAIS